jgi:hypothetical protein
MKEAREYGKTISIQTIAINYNAHCTQTQFGTMAVSRRSKLFPHRPSTAALYCSFI